jgi:hypothetical protein
MNPETPSRQGDRIPWQLLAFGLMILPPIVLAFGLTQPATWLTWVSMGLIAIGMLLAMAVS